MHCLKINHHFKYHNKYLNLIKDKYILIKNYYLITELLYYNKLKEGIYVLIDVEFYYKDFKITSVKKSDINILNEWIILNDKFSVDLFSLDKQLFFRRFLEYYLTEEELFLKIEKDSEIYGVFKGRLELQEKSELFIWLYLIDSRFRNNGLGKSMLMEILQYFKNEYYINSFKVGVNLKNKKAIKFWNNVGFNKLRITKNFFEDNKYETSDLLILNKIS